MAKSNSSFGQAAGLQTVGNGTVAIPIDQINAAVALYEKAAGVAMTYLHHFIAEAYKPTPPVKYDRSYNLIDAALHPEMKTQVEVTNNMAQITITCSLGDKVKHPAKFGANKGTMVNTLALLDYGYRWHEPPQGGHIPWFTIRPAKHIKEKTIKAFNEYARSIGLDATLTIEYD